MARDLCIVSLVLLTVLTGCAGIITPVGLSDNQATRLDTNQSSVLQGFGDTFKVGSELRTAYSKAADNSGSYSFWSAVPYIGVAAATAGILYHGGSNGLIAGLGIGSASWATFNTMVNAKNNGTLYRRGVDAIDCLNNQLESFNKIGTDTSALQSRIQALVDSLRDARSILAKTDPDFSDTQVKAEIQASPSLTTSMISAKTLLASTITEAAPVPTEAQKEVSAWQSLTSYVPNAIKRIDAAVKKKFMHESVDKDYKIAVPSSTPAPNSPPQGVAPNQNTQVADRINELSQNTANLRTLIDTVNREKDAIGVTKREGEVEKCIAAI